MTDMIRNKLDELHILAMQEGFERGFIEGWNARGKWAADAAKANAQTVADNNRPDLKPDKETVANNGNTTTVTYTYNGKTPLTPDNTVACDKCKMHIANPNEVCADMRCPLHDRCDLRERKCVKCGLGEWQTCSTGGCAFPAG